MFRRLTKVALAAVLIAPFAAISQDNAAAPAEAAAAAPAADAAAGGTGTVVFFREKKMMGMAISFKVRENGVELCKLGSGSFCTVTVPVGKHEFVTQTEAKDVLNLEVESGETYYVQASISMGVMAGHGNLAPSTKEAFEGMKAKLKDNTGKDLDPPKEKK
ncbi:MAG TPA: DUF2846 domain-containing protein [Steroidobacteraceae bacterium]|nr:DUF2846 domain-containing protein [Steroidobacteraceae bacterium]